MAEHPSDGEIVAQVLAGEVEALATLLGRYEASSLRFAASIVRDRDDAEDVVQQAFIKAYRNLRAYDGRRPFRPWLLRIVRNEALNWLRRHRRLVSSKATQLVLETTADPQNVHRDVLERELRTMVHDCLLDLPLKYREVLELYYLEEQSYQEISDILRLPIGTVGTHLHRAKQCLRALVEQRGHHD